MSFQDNNISRRKWLKTVLAAPLAVNARIGGVSMMSVAASALATRPVSAAQCQSNRSLVCIFLTGGADSINFFVPRDQYETYHATRSAMAISESDLGSSVYGGGQSYSFPTDLSALEALYSKGQLAVVSNLGPLVQPVTQQDYQNAIHSQSSIIPQSLFAHDAQQKLWQTGKTMISGDSGIGWGGAMASIMSGCGGVGAFSIAGNNIWQAAPTLSASPVSIAPSGNMNTMQGYSNQNEYTDALKAMLNEASQSAQPMLVKEAQSLLFRAQDNTGKIKAKLDAVGSLWDVNAYNDLEHQLHVVARLIKSREALGLSNQVFFVRMGGWDTHGAQLTRLPALMQHLDEAIGKFQIEMDKQNVADSVTGFTASDFGRSMTRNLDGTDHGWGGHSFVFGGAVDGGKMYGDPMNYSSVDNTSDASDGTEFTGRMIPTTSVSQYGATLASWMGIQAGELNTLFPHLPNFNSSNLGFMR